MIPHIHINIDIIYIVTDTMSVGNLGTIPVFRNSNNIGINNIVAKTIPINAINEKNTYGL
jgi:hypothetical protein